MEIHQTIEHMRNIKILLPLDTDARAGHRGGGRIVQMLRENLNTHTHLDPNTEESEQNTCAELKVEFVSSLKQVDSTDGLFVPVWNLFQAPIITKRIAQKQILMIFDVIPLKYPRQFPVGLRGKLALWRNKGALKHFDSFITISERAKQDIVQHLHIPAEKIHVVYPTYSQIFKADHSHKKINRDINASSQSSSHLSSETLKKYKITSKGFVLYVGDINWNKNIVNLAKAIKIAQIPAVFVGKAFGEGPWEGPTLYRVQPSHPWLKEYTSFRAEVAGSSLFSFPGYVSDNSLKILYQHAICNVLISRDEGFGMSYLEAATQGCPSILSDIPVFHEIALNTAMFVPTDDPQATAEGIFQLKTSSKQRDFIGADAYARSEAFALEHFRKNLLTCFEAT